MPPVAGRGASDADTERDSQVADSFSRDPNVRRRRLGIELRRLREAAGLNQREAAASVEFSLSKVIRIETGAQGISVSDLKALLSAYGVTDPAEVTALLDAARASRGKPWWDDCAVAVAPQYARLLGLEGLASEFRVSHPLLIPGLLHTRAYAAALFAAFPEIEASAEARRPAHEAARAGFRPAGGLLLVLYRGGGAGQVDRRPLGDAEAT